MDWSKIFGIGSGLAQAGMGAYQGFGGGYNDPTKGAKNMIGQIPGKTEGYYSPYMEAGKGAMSDLQNQYKNLLSGDTQNQLGANYKESPGYQFKLKQAMQQQGNAAARGGYLGTPMDQQNAAEVGNGLASDDYNQYIQNQMGLYGQGLQGEQGLNQMGYDANKSMADTWGNSMNQQAALDYAGKAGKNTYQQGGWQNAIAGLGQAGSSAMGMPDWMKYFMGNGKGV